MAQIINTDEISIADVENPDHKEWIYNALDCAVTDEVYTELSSIATPEAIMSYDFVRAMQAPALLMMLRGIRVDDFERQRKLLEYSNNQKYMEDNLNELATAVWGKGLNPRSPAQIKKFLYDVLKVPEQYKRIKGVRKVSTDRSALENLLLYRKSEIFIRHILAIRDMSKKCGTLRSGTDADGRMRTSYNVSGTETGRWSSNENVWGTGTNLQNIENRLKSIFVADDGYKLAYIDLEQAESRAVAYITGSRRYADACESGDLHTTVAKMVWPDLPWTGDLAHDRHVVAGELFYRDFTYRDLAKRGGHGTNYRGSPWTMAKHLHVETSVMEGFQSKYFRAFPEIPKYHQRVATRLQTKGFITSPIGRTRVFFGRLDDDTTIREAIAFSPQSTIGELLNLGMWRVWKEMDMKGELQLLAQVHDAILVQYKEEDEGWVLEKATKLLETPVKFPIGTMVIPAGVEGTGWNWQHWSKNNPNGMKKWTGTDERNRIIKQDVSGLLDLIH